MHARYLEFPLDKNKKVDRNQRTGLRRLLESKLQGRLFRNKDG